MSSFKVETIKQQPNMPPAQIQQSVPKVVVNIQSIACLNYPIQALAQIIEGHFDEEPVSPNLLLRALKVISISLKDETLKKSIEKILEKNANKRERVYLLFVYWVSFTNNLLPILEKLEQKLIQSVIGTIFSQYIFTKSSENKAVAQLLGRTIEKSQYNISKISQYIKNQFIDMGYPIQQIIFNVKKIQTKNEKLKDIIHEILAPLFKPQQSEQKLSLLLQRYSEDQQLRSEVDQFCQKYTWAIPIISNRLSVVLQPHQILDVWSECWEKKYRMENMVKSAIKQWLNKKEKNQGGKQRFWIVINLNFNNCLVSESWDKILRLFELGLQLDETSALTEYILKQYLYNCFKGANMLSEIEGLKKYVQGQKQWKKINGEIDILLELSKSNMTMEESEEIKIFTVNRIYAPNNWKVFDLQAVKKYAEKHQIVEIFYNKLGRMMDKLEKKYHEKGKLISLSYHGLVIKVITGQQKGKQFCLTLDQLSTYLTTGVLPQANNTLIEEYRPFEKKQVRIEKKEIHSVVIQAKIVRMLKKSKSKLAYTSMLEETSKQYHISEANFKLALDKTIDKGLIEEEGEGFYLYCA